MTHHLATFQSKTETKRIIYMDLHFLQSEGRKSSKPTPPYFQNFENLWRQNRQKWEKPMAIPKCAKDLLKLTDCWCSCKGNSCGLSFLKNGPVPACFCLFLLFSRYNFNNTNWKSVDGVLGIRTQGRRMVGADETTELWRPLCGQSYKHENLFRAGALV